MNFYNPYLFSMPSSIAPATSGGLISRIFGGIKLRSILNGASKTLNFVNQTIPVIKQVSPMVKNAKTMFKVLNEFKRTDSNSNPIPKSAPAVDYHTEVTNDKYVDSGPTFFI